MVAATVVKFQLPSFSFQFQFQYFQFHFKFINFNSISSSRIWIELQFQFFNWIDPTLHVMAWHWTVTSHYPNQWWPEFVTIWCDQASIRWGTFCTCRSKETVKLQSINLVVMACTKLETTHKPLPEPVIPEFCHYIEPSGLSAGPVNQGGSPVLTVEPWDPCCQNTQYEPFLLMVFSGLRVATDHSSWNSLTFPWQFPDSVTITKPKVNRVHKTVVLIFLA